MHPVVETPTKEMIYFIRNNFSSHIHLHGEENCHKHDIVIEGRYIPAIYYALQHTLKTENIK
jgi:hypothetical protein